MPVVSEMRLLVMFPLPKKIKADRNEGVYGCSEPALASEEKEILYRYQSVFETPITLPL
jgi:hypothetical protein